MVGAPVGARERDAPHRVSGEGQCDYLDDPVKVVHPRNGRHALKLPAGVSDTTALCRIYLFHLSVFTLRPALRTRLIANRMQRNITGDANSEMPLS